MTANAQRIIRIRAVQRQLAADGPRNDVLLVRGGVGQPHRLVAGVRVYTSRRGSSRYRFMRVISPNTGSVVDHTLTAYSSVSPSSA